MRRSTNKQVVKAFLDGRNAQAGSLSSVHLPATAQEPPVGICARITKLSQDTRRELDLLSLTLLRLVSISRKQRHRTLALSSESYQTSA